MNPVTTYFIIGILFGFVVEWLNDIYKATDPFTWPERLAMIVFYPLMIIAWIIMLIKNKNL
jgi:F0F1-type ATP synthase assembly protein I